MTKGRRFFTDELQAVKLPRLGGSCALCVDGLGCGGEQSGYCPRGGNMQRFSFLPGCRVLQIERGSRGSRVILADNRRGSARCPPCGAVSRAVHSRYRRSPADLPDFGHELHVALLVRRFYCRQATCPKRTFAERFAGAVAPYARRARRLAKALGRAGIALGGAAGARFARGIWMPVSRDTLRRVIRALPLPAVTPPPN